MQALATFSMVETVSSCVLVSVMKYSNKSNRSEGRFLLAHGSRPHCTTCGQVQESGTRTSWSHFIHHEEVERDECMLLLPFSIYSVHDPNQGVVNPRVGRSSHLR